MTPADKLTRIAENELKIYEAGKQEVYDAIENGYFREGRTNYAYAFAYLTDEAFPLLSKEYTIKPAMANQLFFESNISAEKMLKLHFDFSRVNSLTNIFQNIWCEEIPFDVDFSVFNPDTVSTHSDVFAYTGKLKTIRKLILHKNIAFTNWFHTCSGLENLTIEGTIGQSGLDLQHSRKLSKSSIQSVIWHLDLTEGRAPASITLSLAAVNKAFETSEGANDGADSDEFNDICVSSRVAGWTISLI